MKVSRILKTCFFASIAVLCVKLGGAVLVTPGIVSKIGGVALVILGVLSTGVTLYCLGCYDK